MEKAKRALWMDNRIKWYVLLADEAGYDSVKVLFLIGMAEAIVRLKVDNLEGRDSSRKYVQDFFNDDMLSVADKNLLENGFLEDLQKKNLEKVVNILCDVRNSVAHGKSHYDFQFSGGPDHLNFDMSMSGNRLKFDELSYDNCTITYEEFREAMKNTAHNWVASLKES